MVDFISFTEDEYYLLYNDLKYIRSYQVYGVIYKSFTILV